MKIYVINLDRSPDRLIHMRQQLEKLGLDYVRQRAVDAVDIAHDALIVDNSSMNWPPLSIAEKACFLSHRACWVQIANGTALYGCVMEDDIVLKDVSKDYLTDDTWFPRNVAIIKLETFLHRVDYWNKEIKIKGDRVLLRPRSFHTGSAAYIISKNFAKKLIQDTTNCLPCPVDHYLFDTKSDVAKKNLVYQMSPAFAAQEQVLENENSLLKTTIYGRSISDNTENEAKEKHKSKFKFGYIIELIIKPFLKPFRRKRLINYG